jgi:hypothetical protein
MATVLEEFNTEEQEFCSVPLWKGNVPNINTEN